MQQLTTLLRNLLATNPERNIKRHAHGLLKALQELNPQDND